MSRTIETILIAFILIIAAVATHAWLASRSDEQQMQSTIASQKKLLDAASARERDRDETLKSTLARIEALKRSTQTPQQIVSELPQYIGLPQPIALSPDSIHPTKSINSASGPNAGADARCDQSSHVVSSSARKGTPIQPSSLPQNTRVLGCASAIPVKSTNPSTSDCTPSLTGLPEKDPSSSLIPGDCTLTAPSTRTANADSAASPIESETVQNSSGVEIPTADLKPLYDYVQDCRACQAQLGVAKQNSTDDAAKITALPRERDAAVKAAKGGGFLQRLRRNTIWFVIGALGGYAVARR